MPGVSVGNQTPDLSLCFSRAPSRACARRGGRGSQDVHRQPGLRCKGKAPDSTPWIPTRNLGRWRWEGRGR